MLFKCIYVGLASRFAISSCYQGYALASAPMPLYDMRFLGVQDKVTELIGFLNMNGFHCLLYYQLASPVMLETHA